MKFLCAIVLAALTTHAQNPLKTFAISQQTQAQATFVAGLAPGLTPSLFSLPQTEFPGAVEEIARVPMIITGVSIERSHPGWKDHKAGLAARFRLPFGLKIAVQYSKGKLGSELTTALSRKF